MWEENSVRKKQKGGAEAPPFREQRVNNDSV
jgi:hypothetical protein